MSHLHTRLDRLEAVRGRSAMRVSDAEQARVQAELHGLRPGLDLAELWRDLLDPARRDGIDTDVLRIVARTRSTLQAMGRWCPVWRSAMNCDLGSNLVLARGLLRLFKLAMVDGHCGVADQLLCALEQLARSDPGCEPMLDHAYLWSVGGHAGAARLRTPGPWPQ